MSDHSSALLIFAKYPEQGRVKTRLTPALELSESVKLYQAFLSDAVESMLKCREAFDLRLLVTGVEDPISLQRLLLDDGVTDAAELFYDSQQGATLGERLFHGFRSAFESGYRYVCAVGTDHPTLPMVFIIEAFTKLRQSDVVVGPAEDGGYYLIGMRGLYEELFHDMPWSTESLFTETWRVIQSREYSGAELPLWYDIDDLSSLRRLVCSDELKGSRSRTEKMVEELQLEMRICGSNS